MEGVIERVLRDVRQNRHAPTQERFTVLVGDGVGWEAPELILAVEQCQQILLHTAPRFPAVSGMSQHVACHLCTSRWLSRRR